MAPAAALGILSHDRHKTAGNPTRTFLRQPQVLKTKALIDYH